jgi:hypothetical protein
MSVKYGIAVKLTIVGLGLALVFLAGLYCGRSIYGGALFLRVEFGEDASYVAAYTYLKYENGICKRYGDYYLFTGSGGLILHKWYGRDHVEYVESPPQPIRDWVEKENLKGSGKNKSEILDIVHEESKGGKE